MAGAGKRAYQKHVASDRAWRENVPRTSFFSREEWITKMEDIRPVCRRGHVGYLRRVSDYAFCGLFVYWVSGWQLHTGVGFTLIGSLLLAATMSSTDSASVFNILRSQQINLKHNR